MNTDQLAFHIWKLLFNRPVKDLTSHDIYIGAKNFLLRHPELSTATPQDILEQAIGEFPPTTEEVAAMAYTIWKHNKEAGISDRYNDASLNWIQAEQFVWRSRSE